MAPLSRVLPLMTLCNRDMETFLYVQKHVLVRRGVLRTTYLRRPHRVIDERLSAEVDELLDGLGILELLITTEVPPRCKDALNYLRPKGAK